MHGCAGSLRCRYSVTDGGSRPCPPLTASRAPALTHALRGEASRGDPERRIYGEAWKNRTVSNAMSDKRGSNRASDILWNLTCLMEESPDRVTEDGKLRSTDGSREGRCRKSQPKWVNIHTNQTFYHQKKYLSCKFLVFKIREISQFLRAYSNSGEALWILNWLPSLFWLLNYIKQKIFTYLDFLKCGSVRWSDCWL